LTKKRWDDVMWEKQNDLEKYKKHAWEYLDEFLPLIEKILEPKKAKKK